MNERVEAAAKAMWDATRPGIAWDELRESSREPIRVQARAALAAADAVSGERAKDATIAALRAEVERLTKELDDAQAMLDNEPTPAPLTLAEMARRLGVQSTWLRKEASAGRLPHIDAGTTMLFHPETVKRLLLERTKSEQGRHA